MRLLEDMEVSSLILMSRANDNFAFTELLTRYKPMITKVISDLDVPVSRFEEARSEALEAFYRAVMSYDLSSAEVTFGLYSRICVYRRVCDFVGRELKIPEFSNVDVEDVSVSNTVERGIVSRENVARFMKVARSVLSDYEYRIFGLYLSGYRTREIAALLSRTPKSVDNAKARMFRRLRECGSSFFD